MWRLTQFVSHYLSISGHQSHTWRCLTWLVHNSWIKWTVTCLLNLWMFGRGCFRSFFDFFILSVVLTSISRLQNLCGVEFAAVWLQLDFILFGVKQQLHQKLESPSCRPKRVPADRFNFWFKHSEFLFLILCTETDEDVKSLKKSKSEYKRKDFDKQQSSVTTVPHRSSSHSHVTQLSNRKVHFNLLEINKSHILYLRAKL